MDSGPHEVAPARTPVDVTLLFVYGSLASHSEHPMAHRLRDAARFVGRARLSGRCVQLDGYPGLLPPSARDQWVVGELYEFADDDLLHALDAYEGCHDDPPEFERRVGEVELPDGERRAAQVYYYGSFVM